MYERRATKILNLIRDRPQNAFEIAVNIWSDVAIAQAFLTLSQVLGHIDLLIDRKQVYQNEDEKIIKFHPV
jgi:hypothetical protein